MDQPESPVRHGLENILIGPMYVKSGVEYVLREDIGMDDDIRTITTGDFLPLEPTLPQPPYSSTDDLLASILVQLVDIKSQLDSLSTYTHTPWYKRLAMWFKGLF